MNAKNGDWGMKQRQYQPGDSFEIRLRRQFAQRICMAYPDTDEERAKKIADDYRNGNTNSYAFMGEAKSKAISQAFDLAKQDVAARGLTLQGYSEWAEGEQLASRPVMFPWEIIDAHPEKSIVIVPGRYNVQLQRYVYYSDPVLSKWARPDPKFPQVEVQQQAPQPVVPAPLVMQAPGPAHYAPQSMASPPPAGSVGAVASEIGSAVGGWLSKKVNEKLGGK